LRNGNQVFLHQRNGIKCNIQQNPDIMNQLLVRSRPPFGITSSVFPPNPVSQLDTMSSPDPVSCRPVSQPDTMSRRDPVSPPNPVSCPDPVFRPETISRPDTVSQPDPPVARPDHVSHSEPNS
jgi:hypothetical protein